MNYAELTLHENLQKGIQEAGYVACTPVQEQVLSVALDGSDLYVQSQTGTGKTAAYLVTIMQELLTREGVQGKKALIMVPTRELAVQVEEEAKKLGKYTGLSCESFYGGVGYDKQVSALKKGVDIIVGTPGRVIDLQEGKQMDLSAVAFLVIDEADRMFDMGFYPDLRKLIKVLPKNESRQTMLFSATLNSYVKNLAWEYTHEAKEITIEAENITVDEIDQELIHVSSDEKMALLVGILAREKPASTIIFCNTKRMCEVLSKRLTLNGIESEFLIGDLPQSKRLKIMDAFKAGKISCLVATDVAARGIDVNDLAMVVNYDLPNEAENYVHRIGRTARAGKSGKAYTFCSEQDVYSLVPIERYIEKQIPSRVAVAEDFGEDKSKGVYIRTEDWREDSDRRSRRTASGRGRAESSRSLKGTRRERGERSERENRRRRDRGEARTASRLHEHTSQEELTKLAAMTADERKAYYKEKYARLTEINTKSTAEKARATRGSIKTAGVPRGRAQKQVFRRRNSAVPTAAATRMRSKGKTHGDASSKRSAAAPKKLGLLARLKSLIGRKK